MTLEFGVWAPVCGGWLRVRDHECDTSPERLVDLGLSADRLGYHFYYVPENYLNAVYGPDHPVADAGVVAIATAAQAQQIRVVTAVQPGFKQPGAVAKMAASISALRPDAFGISVVAGWWRQEVEAYGDVWLPHHERYARAGEFLDLVRRYWTEPKFDYRGRYYSATAAVLEPRPNPLPPVFIAGESDSAIALAARAGDYLFINGDQPERVARLASKVKRLAAEQYGRNVKVALSALAVLGDTSKQAQAHVERLRGNADLATIRYFSEQIDGAVVAHNRGAKGDSIEANLGLNAGIIGDANAICRHLRAFEQAGVDAVLLKFDDTENQIERFAREVTSTYNKSAVSAEPRTARAAGAKS